MAFGDCPESHYSLDGYILTDGVAAEARLAQVRARRMIETSFRHRFVQALPQQQQNNTVEGPRAAGYRAPEADCMVVTAS